MAPLDPADVKEHYGRTGGQFTSVRKLLKPGESKQALITDISKNFKTKFPMKDKDYAYRVSLTVDGQPLLLDVNSKGLLAQFVSAAYPEGPEGAFRSCTVTLHRLTERSRMQSELQVMKPEVLPDNNPPF